MTLYCRYDIMFLFWIEVIDVPIAPKYYQVKTDILSRITDGTYKAQQPLPSEKELMERYDISRITVRKALDDLANEGYLYKIQGKGTFVGDPRKRGINILRHTSCISELRQRGYSTRRVVLNAKIMDCDEAHAQQYGLCLGERYFKFERIYTGDDVPYSYEISFYLYRYVSGIERRDLAAESIHAVLRDLHFDDLTINRTTEIQAILSQGDLCDKLRLPEGRPLLRMCFHSYLAGRSEDRNPVCVEYSLAVWRTDIIPVMIV